MKRILFSLMVLTLVVGVASGFRAVQFLNTPVRVPADGMTFEIPPGTAFAAVSRQLAENGVIEHPTMYRWYARITGDASRVRAGEYELTPGLTPPELLQKFVSGEVRLHSFTIVEGWTFRELLLNLSAMPAVDSSLEYDDWPELLASLGSDAPHPEGLFLPETYRFPRYTRDAVILGQAYRLMDQTLTEAWPDRDTNLPLASPYEALILASIVEKETARPDERARIAGVFVRRLNKRMRLQTDPTVIYGVGVDFDGNLTRRDLTTDTPYNTYMRGGLPPTPIALPGRAAINAVLHPATGDELYFVATGLPDGSHTFSATKEEHDAAVSEYLRRLREARKGTVKR